ncbi:MAG TPA: hypothetical protein VGI92_11550 [Gemmatimonadales bacterium]|jgi:hypothetical protein
MSMRLMRRVKAMRKEGTRSRLTANLLRGAAAGLAGAVAMRLAHMAEQRALLPRGAKGSEPSAAMVKALAESREIPVSDGLATAVGIGLQLGLGAAAGAALAAAQNKRRWPTWVNGLGLAGATWALTVPKGGILPKLGAAPPAENQSLDKVAIGMGAHLAYGFATAAALRALSDRS